MDSPAVTALVQVSKLAGGEVRMRKKAEVSGFRKPNCEVASDWQVPTIWQGPSWHCPTSYIARARGFSARQRESAPQHAVWGWLESVTWRANLLAEAFVTGTA